MLNVAMHKIYAANINLKNNLIGASGLKELKGEKERCIVKLSFGLFCEDFQATFLFAPIK